MTCNSPAFSAETCMYPIEPRVARPWCRDQRMFVLLSVVTRAKQQLPSHHCVWKTQYQTRRTSSWQAELKNKTKHVPSRCLLELKTASGKSTRLSLSERLSLNWMKSSNSVLSLSLSAWSATTSQGAPMSLLLFSRRIRARHTMRCLSQSFAGSL